MNSDDATTPDGLRVLSRGPRGDSPGASPSGSPRQLADLLRTTSLRHPQARSDVLKGLDPVVRRGQLATQSSSLDRRFELQRAASTGPADQRVGLRGTLVEQEGDGWSMRQLKAHGMWVFRRGYIVAAVAILAALAGWSSVRGTGTTYTGTSALITVSSNRSPDQDGILAQGYADFFLEPSFQDVLRQRAEVPPSVVLSARTAAAGPIIYVSATSTDRALAQAAATRLAEEFRLEVNAALQTSRQQLIAQMTAPVESQRKSGTLPQVALLALQDRINALNGDSTNQLQILRTDSGVATTRSPVLRTTGVALGGGAVFGIALAWLLGFASRRLMTVHDLEEKSGVTPLAILHHRERGAKTPGTDPEREEQLRQLAATIALTNLPHPAVVAVAPVRSTAAAAEIGPAVAAYRAAQGVRTVLVHADPTLPAVTTLPVVDRLVEGLFVLTAEHDGLREIFPAADLNDVRTVLSVERLDALVDELRPDTDLVVISAPPTAVFAESRMVCASADCVVLVVEAGTPVHDVVAVRDDLRDSGVVLLGAVFQEQGRRARRTPRRSRAPKAGFPGSSTPRESPAMPSQPAQEPLGAEATFAGEA
jgi:succinoglycan biosynthesis transport protein ExoP